MSLHVKEEPSDSDFLVELYGEVDQDAGDMVDIELEELVEYEEDDQVIDKVDDEDSVSDEEISLLEPTAPAYSPMTSPESRARRTFHSYGDRVRSRSPVTASCQDDPLLPLGVVITIYDQDGVPLDEVDQDEFITPDSHALYECNERMESIFGDRAELDRSVDDDSSMIGDRGVVEDRSDMDVSVRSVRGRVRGGRRGRGRPCRGRGGGRRRRVGPHGQWEVGHPLEEIWLTDDDVPSELRQMVRDVVRRRQARTQVSASANRSTQRRDTQEEGEGSVSEDDDVFLDAMDGRDNSLLEGENPHFEWSSMETFRGKEETFRPQRTGSVESYTTAYDAFRSYWDDSVIQRIVDETNQYATKIPSASFQSDWYPTNSHEVLCLFAFWMMLGIIRMPTIVSCFSTSPLLKTEIFRRIFTSHRYSLLSRALNFVEAAYPTNRGPAANFDRVHRLRPIITHLNAKFQANYIMSKDICIDESLTLWKGRLNIRQYIRSKAAKFGIKTFELCESATGYLWSFLVYTGKQSAFDLDQNHTGLKSTAVVKKLIAPLLNKGYRLFMDNWYNSPLLARFLKRNGTDCVGTLRASRQDVPVIINHAPLKRGQLIARHSGDICVLSWQDKKRVNMISTCHGSAIGLPTVASHPTSRPLPYKPQVVLDYNKYMGGVDLKDQMLEPYLIERKRCAKWYIKLFKRLLNCSILNSRILLQSSMQQHQDHLNFRLQLVDSILNNHLSHCPLTRRQAAHFSRTPHPARLLQHTHWLVPIPVTEGDRSRNRKSRQRCAVCTAEKRYVRTSYKCVSCDVPLCVVDCYKKYHTM